MSLAKKSRKHIKQYDDRGELIDIANFIRSAFPGIKVRIEHFIFFDEDGKFERVGKVVHEGITQKFRNPDLMLHKDGNLLCCVEIDGGVHDYYVEKTERRNDDYKNASIDLVVANKEEIRLAKSNVFEFLEREISQRLNHHVV